MEIEFYNRTDKIKKLWVEPSCEEIDLDSNSEFKIVTQEEYIRFEYDSDDFIILYLQYSFGFKLYKRKYKSNIDPTFSWELVFDHSDIN